MGKSRDVKKERFWRKLIRRQASSGQSVRRFCTESGVRDYQFHWWRRTIQGREESQASHKPSDAQGESNGGGGFHDDASSLVPVRIPFPIGVPLEIVHPGGCVVRVPAIFDSSTLRCLLATLDPPNGK